METGGKWNKGCLCRSRLFSTVLDFDLRFLLLSVSFSLHPDIVYRPAAHGEEELDGPCARHVVDTSACHFVQVIYMLESSYITRRVYRQESDKETS